MTTRTKKKADFLGNAWHQATWECLSITRLRQLARLIRAFERKHKTHVDAFAGMGVSGAIPAALLAHHMSRGLFIVRRKGETLSSSNLTRSVGVVPLSRKEKLTDNTSLNYMIVDDLVSTGATVRRVYTKLIQRGGNVVGMLRYDTSPSLPVVSSTTGHAVYELRTWSELDGAQGLWEDADVVEIPVIDVISVYGERLRKVSKQSRLTVEDTAVTFPCDET